MRRKILLTTAASACVLSLSACSGGGGTAVADNAQDTLDADSGGAGGTACSGTYDCKTGATEPLYKFQWALKAATSFFKDYPQVADGDTDLRVEDLHAANVKGLGVNVFVADDGIDINHPDLKANVDTSMTYNFVDGSSDPKPPAAKDAHGTNVAGIIAAAQNGIGVMGVAPLARLGGTRYDDIKTTEQVSQMFGGAAWSKAVDVYNMSLGDNPVAPPTLSDSENAVARANMLKMRAGKGVVVVKSAGNEFANDYDDKTKIDRTCPTVGGVRLLTCGNPVLDSIGAELPIINIAAANAKGRRAAYSSAGASNWVTGLGGAEKSHGDYGETSPTAEKPDSGPQLYSTDLTGCDRGYASNPDPDDPNDDRAAFMVGGTAANQAINKACDYSQMNGTSSAAPTVTGVVALMLSANPKLTWRDIREILASTSRQIDPDYGKRDKRDQPVKLTQTPEFCEAADACVELADGNSHARLDYGWRKNAAGYWHSTWYGFGLVDAKAAVEKAKATTSYKPASLDLSAELPFTAITALKSKVEYGKVTKLGTFSVARDIKVDALQLRLKSPDGDLCIGSVGIHVKSPSGTLSALWDPYNIYYRQYQGKDLKLTSSNDFGVVSYGFYGENAKGGDWEVWAVSGTPQGSCGSGSASLKAEFRIIAKP